MFSLKKHFILLLILSFPFSLFCKPKNKTVYKYVHPREYEFDLCDTKNQLFFGLNKNNNKFECKVDFTHLVKNDMPQSGDKIIFHYNGKATKSTGRIIATIVDEKNSWKNLVDDQTRFFANVPTKEDKIEGTVSFVLTENSKDSIVLYLESDKKNKPFQIDQVFLRFKRVVDSTNTIKEAEVEKRAEKQNIEIIEVKTQIVDDYVDPEIENQKRLLEEENRKKEEEKKLEEEKQRIEQEKIKIQKEKEELEKKRQEELLLKTLEYANLSKNTTLQYQKEYLFDYAPKENEEYMINSKNEKKVYEKPNLSDSFGRTLLMIACKNGDVKKVDLLIKSGANVNLVDNDGWSSLMYAVRYQENIEIVNLLIKANAKINVNNFYDSSLLSITAIYNKNPKILRKILTGYSPKETEVIKSLCMLISTKIVDEKNKIEKINEFIHFQTPINSFYDGKTPLMYAGQNCENSKVIDLLLLNGAKKQVRSKNGMTALDYARQNKKLTNEVLEKLKF